MGKRKALLIIYTFFCTGCIAQSNIQGFEHLLTEPKFYSVNYTSVSPEIDGDINDAAWNIADWSSEFVDIEGEKKPVPLFKTRMKMLWNDSTLFIAAHMEEPHIWAKLQNHDDTIYFDNDFEVFIDPDNNAHEYYEVEVNALNKVFDLFMKKPYRDGGRAEVAWNLDDLKSAVQIQGTLNDPRNKDKGWTVEMAIPFAGLKKQNDAIFPKEGSIWRINFSRVEWEMEIKENKYVKKKDKNGKPLPEHNWVWSPQGMIDMHMPERWGYLLFSNKNNGQESAHFTLPFSEKQKRFLWLIYYKQQQYLRTNKVYASSLSVLGIPEKVETGDTFNILEMKGNGKSFIVTIRSKSGSYWSINEEGLIYCTKKDQ